MQIFYAHSYCSFSYNHLSANRLNVSGSGPLRVSRHHGDLCQFYNNWINIFPSLADDDDDNNKYTSHRNFQNEDDITIFS